MVKLFVVLGGLAALARLLRRRLQGSGEPAATTPVADRRAEELRRKLDESRPLVAEPEAFEPGDVPVDRATPEPDERRREVHERAREAVERMRGDAP